LIAIAFPFDATRQLLQLFACARSGTRTQRPKLIR
jgi:hypothetical protein